MTRLPEDLLSRGIAALLATLAASACAADQPREFVGATEDGAFVEIWIDGDSVSAELGGGESFAGDLSVDTFQLRSEMGSVLDGLVDQLVLGSITSAGGELVPFTASEVEPGEPGRLTRETNTYSVWSSCYCSTIYHRVYCRGTDGSWFWTGGHC